MVHVFKRNAHDGMWPSIKFVADAESVNGLSWAPSSVSQGIEFND